MDIPDALASPRLDTLISTNREIYESTGKEGQLDIKHQNSQTLGDIKYILAPLSEYTIPLTIM